MSIRFKIIIMIVLISIIFGSASVIVCSNVITNRTNIEYKKRASEIVWTVANSIDADKVLELKNKVYDIYDTIDVENKVGSWDWGSDDFNDYIAKYDSLYEEQSYKDLLEYLKRIAKVNEVDCIYVLGLDEENHYCVYLADSSEEDACPIGCIDPIYDINSYIFDDYSVGIKPYITNTEEYGWLVTSGAPIFASNGDFVGLIATDISMEIERQTESKYIKQLVMFLIVTIVVISIISTVIIEFVFIKPLHKITTAAKEYCNEDIRNKHTNFERLDIKSNDEIKELVHSMKVMENDINEQVANLINTSNELMESRNVVNEMTQLANIDSLTGLKNKTAYDNHEKLLIEDINQGKAVFGIVMIDLNYLKYTNDNFGHEKGNEALKELGNIICSIFTKSQIYRVGGDEFVVIVERNDYNNIETLVETFKTKMLDLFKDEKLKPWLRISAAIGYSVFNPSIDKDVNTVFDRADKSMYINKKEIKHLDRR